jgi:drug/metabolite transporter (DMT)-like permease
LKEKLSWKHYTTIIVAVAGIVILGLYDAWFSNKELD